MQYYRSGHSCSLESASQRTLLAFSCRSPLVSPCLCWHVGKARRPSPRPQNRHQFTVHQPSLTTGGYPWILGTQNTPTAKNTTYPSTYHWYILSQNTCSVKPTSRTTAQVGMNTRQTCKIQVCQPGLGACSALSLAHCCWERYFRLVCVQRKYEKKQKCIMSSELNRIHTATGIAEAGVLAYRYSIRLQGVFSFWDFSPPWPHDYGTPLNASKQLHTSRNSKQKTLLGVPQNLRSALRRPPCT